jgi:hypothetical protein
MSKIPAINEIDANSPSQESTEVVVKATTVTPNINEIQETISASATIQEIDGTRKPTISEIYKIVNDGLFESTTNWWDYAYKLSQAQLNQDIISRLDNGVIGGGYSKGVEIITTTSNKVPNNTNVYSALKSDSLYPKKLNDEIINGIYDFLNGLTIGKPTAYTGGTWSVDKTGRTHLTTDYLYVRLKAIFETLQILNVDTIGGKLVISPAGSIRVAYVDRIKIDAPVFIHNEETDVWSISQVENAEGNLVNETLNQEVYRCYFLGEQDGEEIDNKWKVGDQAQAKTFNVKKGTYHKVENSYLWRLVVNVSSDTVDIDGKKYHYVDLSQIDFDSGSDAPAPGDILNQLGHRLNDTQRQTALVLNAVDNYAPSITLYAGVNYYTLLNKEYVEFGVYNGKAFFNVYGDMYIGDKGTNPKTYIKYKNGKINIKANLEIGSSIGDKDLDQYIKENGGVDEETVKNLINNAQVIKDLQNQADGAIETWFYEGVPTLKNLPAVDWTTEDLKKIHIGDLYYDQTTGYAYRFTKYNDDVNPYRWNRIKDNDIVAALDAANRAQATADGKMKVFYGEAKPTNYKVGDMWVNATLEGKFNNDIARAVADNKTSFNTNDWVLASRYSENIATIQKWTNEYETKFDIIKNQIDGKSGTWYQIDDPSESWTDKASHEGDIWYNTTNGTTNYWNGSAWEQMDIPKDVFDTIDGKSSIFIDSYVDAKAGTGVINKGYKERDLWILPADATINGVKYYKGDMLTAVSNNTNFDETNWKKKVRYIGPTELTSAIDIVNDKINTINNTTIPGINNKFNEFVKDGVLDSSEKARLTDLLNQASNEVAAIIDQVNNITTSKYLTDDNANKGKLKEANTVMNTAWTEYKNLIDTLVNANTEITKVNIGEANTKYKNLQEKIKAVKQYLAICQADILSGMGTDITSYKYLKDALNQTTEINGGLVLTSAIQLKDVNKKVTAGMNGIVKGDKTSIAAWYGGPMVDRDTFTSEELKTKVPGTDYAMSLLRHDGTGYLAGGNIHWNSDGVLSGNFNSFILQGTSMVTIFYYIRLFYLHIANQDTTDFNNIDYVTPMKTFSRLSVLPLGGIEGGNSLPTGLFIGDNKTGGSFQIGNIILRTKSGDPNILEIVSATDGKTAHLGVQGGVSAYGTYTPSTGGGGGLNGTIIPYSTAIISDPQDEGSKIASASSIYKLHSRISAIENNGATSITVTGTGNAITNVSKNGTSITFTKGATFLTSHQSLSNYYTKSETDSKLNGYLPLSGGTMQANARITHGDGNLYIGNTNNNNWLAVQNICSQDSIGDGKWSIRVDGTASFQSIKFPSNRCISQVKNGSNSPLKGIKLPNLGSNGIGIFSRVGNGANEGGIVLSEDTCVIYNSFAAGWGLSVRDKDLNQIDISSDDTVAFGIRDTYKLYSRGGFEKKDSSDDYVLLGGGGHKLESALSVASASVASRVYGQVGNTGSHELVRCDMNDDKFRIIAGSNGNNNGWAEIAIADDGSEPIYVRQYTGVFSSVVRTLTLLDANGYTHFPSYINIGGNENNNSSPDRVWGSNGSDSYLRSYRTSALSVAKADTVDGYHANGLLTSVTNTNNGISVTVGGTTKSVSNINVNGANTILGTSPQIAAATENNSIYVSSPSYSSNKPVKMLCFDWHDNYWALSNIRSGSTPSNGFGVFFKNTEIARFTSDGNLSCNAASATKLQTPRTIWGNSFNGTNNIGGTIIPSATHTYNLGSTTYMFERTYTRFIDTDSGYDLKLCCSGSEVLGLSSGDKSVNINYDANISGKTNISSDLKVYNGTYHACSVVISEFKGNDSNVGSINVIDTNGYAPNRRPLALQYGQGNVGIGTLTPSEKLEVNGGILVNADNSEDRGLKIRANSRDVLFGVGTSTKIGVYNYSDNKWLFYTDISTFCANGNILATGGVTAYQSSDVRLKTNITKLNCLKVIKSIGGTYEFDYIRDHKHSIGFIAQNINNPLLNDIVAKDDNGYLKINYWNPKLISLAFGALTEIDDEVDKLKARVTYLESEVERLTNDNRKLEATNNKLLISK